MISLTRRLTLPVLATSLLLSGCASPPLSLYTLGMPSDQTAHLPNLSAHAPTVQISRVVIPDYLDNQDMILRDHEKIIRSPKARWASRLSVGMTDLITNQIATSHPNELITDQPLSEPATWRVQINVSRFDVDTNGKGTLYANWAVLPSNLNKPLIRQRAHIVMSGSVSSDADIASLMRKLVIMLASQVNSSLPPA